MKYTLPDGSSIEGTNEQVLRMLNALGIDPSFMDKEFYHSSSKGTIRIADMETTHLKNAVLKQYREWVANLSSETNPRELVTKIVNGITNVTWKSMLVELSKRKIE